jgi:hypothetical protein
MASVDHPIGLQQQRAGSLMPSAAAAFWLTTNSQIDHVSVDKATPALHISRSTGRIA